MVNEQLNRFREIEKRTKLRNSGPIRRLTSGRRQCRWSCTTQSFAAIEPIGIERPQSRSRLSNGQTDPTASIVGLFPQAINAHRALRVANPFAPEPQPRMAGLGGGRSRSLTLSCFSETRLLLERGEGAEDSFYSLFVSTAQFLAQISVQKSSFRIVFTWKPNSFTMLCSQQSQPQ